MGLTVATKALAAGDEVGALGALLAVWRETRASDVADLIDAVSARLAPRVFQPAGKLDAFQAGWLAMVERGRPADLPRLLQTMLHETQRSGTAIVEAFAQRARAIGRWPADPRTGKGIATHLRSSSFGAMSKSNQGAWQVIFQLVLDHDDPRSIALFAKVDFTRMFAGWNDVAGRIAFMQPAVDALVAELRRRHPRGAPKASAALARDVVAARKAIRALPDVTVALARELATPPEREAPAPVRVRAGRAAGGDARTAGKALDGASRALSNGDAGAALEALLGAWRATRSSRIGELVEAVSERLERSLEPIDGSSRAEIQSAWLRIAKRRQAIDLPRLLRSITHTHHRATDALARLRALDGWPADPRAALGVVRNLESIPFHTSSTKPFWSALIAFAATHGDRRSADALDGIAKRMSKILRSSYADLAPMRAWFAKQVTAAANEIRSAVTEPVLDPATLASCARIAEQIGAFEDATDRLLAEIAASPDDDHLRQVYADGLQQKGDPRGELIALQLANRDPARQESLLATHAAQWLGPIAPIAWVDGTVFERGFPVAVWLREDRNADALERAVGHPIWATVRRLSLMMDALPAALLEHAVMQRLEHFGAYEADVVLERLRWPHVPYRSLGIDSDFATASAAQRAFLAAGKKLAKLRAIELGGAWFSEPAAASWLLASPIAKRLERIAIVDQPPALGDWVRAIGKLAVRTLAFVEPGRRGGCFELARDQAGQFSQARVRVGGDLAYRAVVRLLDSLAADSLTRLEITGAPPKPAERKRVDAAISRVHPHRF